MPDTIHQLLEAGQSVWLDYIRRGILKSGELHDMVVEKGWIRGETSNPTIFHKAIADSDDYVDAFAALASQPPLTPYEAYLKIAGDDIRAAADVFRPLFDATGGADGFISFEAQAGDSEAMFAEAKRMFALVDRPNVMIKVPGVPEGVPTVERLIAEGINVNITLLFDVAMYERFAEAYLKGLETRLAAGKAIANISSVASFFVSRVDTKADALLPEGSPLRGKVAVANARHAYGRFEKIFSGPRWDRLAAAGARLQRPLWASTGTKNTAYSDVLYVDELVAPHTVNTMPEATLNAFLDHGKVSNAIAAGMAESEKVLAEAAAAGVDLDKVTADLLQEGLASFAKDFDALLAEIDKRTNEARSTSSSLSPGERAGVRDPADKLGPLAPHVDRRLKAMADANIVDRIWQEDHTAWKDDKTEITEPFRLGWLSLAQDMRDDVADLEAFAAEVAGEGFTDAVLCGMGGSSLAPEVFARTFGSSVRPGGNRSTSAATAESVRPEGNRRTSGSVQGPGLALHVLDSTVPADILALGAKLDLGKTLFIISSKSGTTIETLSHFAHFWQKAPHGRQFIAITDKGSALAALARDHGFRRAFLTADAFGGRYSALSYFGLVPAALLGVDLNRLLDGAAAMAAACATPVAENPGARLGAVLGEAAFAGRDKLTLVLPPELASLGDWIEQLVAESTGKEDRGIIPIVGELLDGPTVYGNDRIFVAATDSEGLDAIASAGQPVYQLSTGLNGITSGLSGDAGSAESVRPEGNRRTGGSVQTPVIPAPEGTGGSVQTSVTPEDLGGAMFLWEFATAVAGHILKINAFDQPNVEAAKQAARDVLAQRDPQPTAITDPAATVASINPGDYAAIQAYLPRDAGTRDRLEAVRLRLRDRCHVATTLGYGPRYLHSTGQVHKGGPNEGVFFQLVTDVREDIPIPGQDFTFGRLNRAQADGDYHALEANNRRVVRTSLEKLEEALR